MQEALVFGRGQLYRQKEDYIKENFYVKGFLDNGIMTNDEVYCDNGIPVYHPENTAKYLKNDTLIILMSYQYVSMWEQLYRLGIRKEKILFGIAFPPLSESEAVLFENNACLSIGDADDIYYLNHDRKVRIKNHRQIREMANSSMRERYRNKFPVIDAISKMDVEPISRKFGTERGKAIDRYYIEHFLEKNREFIRGDCLEIAENTYTLCYGGDRVKNAYILHVKGWGVNAVKGNLETGEGINENQFDCAIITQTLMFIYGLENVATNIHKMLKKGGNALITVAGISQISRHDAELWGSYYSFHEDAMKSLFEPVFGSENIKVEVYGNVKTATAMLCGLCQEDLDEEDFDYNDRDYPVIISVLLHKDARERK